MARGATQDVNEFPTLSNSRDEKMVDKSSMYSYEETHGRMSLYPNIEHSLFRFTVSECHQLVSCLWFREDRQCKNMRSIQVCID